MSLPIQIVWTLVTGLQGLSGVIKCNNISLPPMGLSSSQKPARHPASVPYSCPNLGCFGICLLKLLDYMMLVTVCSAPSACMFLFMYWLPTACTSHLPLLYWMSHSAPLSCTVHCRSFCFYVCFGFPRFSGHLSEKLKLIGVVCNQPLWKSGHLFMCLIVHLWA